MSTRTRIDHGSAAVLATREKNQFRLFFALMVVMSVSLYVVAGMT